MKGKRNGRWVAGALAAACVLIVLCALVSPGGNLPSPSGSPAQVDIELPAQDASQIDAVSPTGSGSASDDVGEPPFGGLEYEPGIVLVTLSAGVSPADAVAAIAQDTGLEGLALADEADAAARAVTAAETPLLVELSLPGGVSVEDATALISASPAIEAVQPNFVYYLSDVADPEQAARESLVAQNYLVQDLVAQAAVNDEHISEQWALESIYAYHVGTAADSDAHYAWDVAQANGDVAVAVIDEGFQADHPDLVDNVVKRDDVLFPYNATDGSNDVSEIQKNGHGTHVAGIVAATANNGEGIAGVSYNAKLLLVKGGTATSTGKASFDTAHLAAAFAHVVDLKTKCNVNVRVINMSIAGGTGSSATGWADNELIKAIDNATAAGIVVVCSAGNNFTDGNNKTWTPPYTCYPADYANVVSVINLQKNNGDPHNVSRASSSNYNANASGHNANNGGKVSETGKNISAPGTKIYSTIPNSDYGDLDGTSMASPVVAGSLALAFAANPNLTASQATSLLYTTATDVGDAGWDAQTGYGEVNAYGLVSNASSYLSGGTTVQKGKTITFTVSSGASGVAWYTSDSSVATVNGGVVTGVAGGQARITAGRLVKVFGFTSVIPIGSQVVTVYDPSISPSATTVTAGGTATLTMNCSQSGSWNWTSSDASVATVTSSGSTVTVSGKKIGSATITATLNSNSNISTTAKVTVSAVSLSSATVTLSPSSYTYDGKAKTPAVTVKVGSRTLTQGTDYTVSWPSGRTAVGTHEATVTGKGNYTGTAQGSFSIVKGAISWKRLWGDTALDTMREIVAAGGWTQGGTVVLATSGGYYDGLTANGVAGLADAPIVMTDGFSLSSQARSVISSLKPAAIIVCGGPAAISDATVEAARAAAGTSPKVTRLWGQTADETAVSIFQQGAGVAGGSWSSTAFVCTDAGYWDALSAAPVSYAKRMPIFLTRGGGASLSASAVSAMKSGGVKSAYIVGGEAAVAPAVAAQLEAAGISVSGRLRGGDAIGTSVEVARFGMAQGLSANGAGVATTGGYWDALAGAALCGHVGSVIVLVDGPSAATIANILAANSISIAQGYVFGGASAVSPATYNALPK